MMLAACQVKNDAFDPVKETQEQLNGNEFFLPEITAVQESSRPTKSTLEVDEDGVGTIFWTPADEINVFFGTVGTHYVSKNTTNATTAAFKTTDVIGISEGSAMASDIWGLYPYNEGATCNGTSVSTSLPAMQYAVPGSFDDDLFITLAHNNSTALEFYNVCGGIKFSLTSDDITKITFQGNNDEELAGAMSLNFVDGVPSVNVTTGVKTITLTPKNGGAFESGVYYYLVLRPITLSGGFTMTFETNTHLGTFNYSAKAVTIKRSVFSKKDNIDSFAEFVDNTPTIPDNVILYTSFDGNVVLPNDESAFNVPIVSNEYVNGVGTITFDGDLTSIGERAFSNCVYLKSIAIPHGVESIGDVAFKSCYLLESIALPPSVTSIGVGAFSYCYRLQSISPPSGLTRISESAFLGCSSLRTITIPSGVTEIGASAFKDCSSLQSLTIPSGVTEIGDYAFDYCSNLQAISLPSSITSLGISAFRGCNLQSFSIPVGVTYIPQDLFSQCTNLQSITIPNGVTSIGSGVFVGCNSLESIVLPESIMALYGGSIFDSALKRMTVLAINPPDWGSARSKSLAKDIAIFVPMQSYYAYLQSEGWRIFATNISPIVE